MLGLGVSLSLTDLSGACGVTNNELDEAADSLQGATMPHGLKYQDRSRARSARMMGRLIKKEPKGR